MCDDDEEVYVVYSDGGVTNTDILEDLNDAMVICGKAKTPMSLKSFPSNTKLLKDTFVPDQAPLRELYALS
jgi:hypothetical protein